MDSMKYNFDKSIDRRLTRSYKWDIKEDEYSFSIADMDFLVAEEISKAIKDRAEQATYGYTYVPKEYFQAYIRWWKDRYNTTLKEEWFCYSASVVASIDVILKRVTIPNDKVAIFSPNYNVFYNCINNNKCVLNEIPLDYIDNKYSIDYEKLEKALKESKVFILCNPHNPIGHGYSEKELKNIVELCKKFDVYLISDEIHSDLDFNIARYTPILKVTDYKKAIMLISPSKTFNVAGLHSSVVVIPDPTLRELIQNGLYQDDVGEPNYFSIEPVIAAYTKCDEYVNELNDYIKENRRFLSEFFVKNGIKYKIVSENFTYLLWVDITAYSSDSEEFSNRLFEKYHCKVMSGKSYHEFHSSFIRINIATQLKNIKKLCDALKNISEEK